MEVEVREKIILAMATSSPPPPSCACKGIRSCNLCEPNKETIVIDDYASRPIFIYCDGCRQAIRMDIYESNSDCPHQNEIGNRDVAIPIDGIFLIPEFLSEDEENQLLERIDDDVWIPSQSGRLKQDFGIKINFKKQTIKTKYFTGMPWYSHSLIERFRQHRLLKDFHSVELCNLDYRPERGSHIDPHIDDVWIWGERLITINLLSNTILTLISNNNDEARTIYIPLPRRWLVVLYGDARYEYKHAIQRQHIHDRRVAVTFRELTSKNEKFYEENKELYERIFRIGQRMTGISVGRFEQLANVQAEDEMETNESDSNVPDEMKHFLDQEETSLSVIERARRLAQWRLGTHDQMINSNANFLTKSWWNRNYRSIIEQKKTNYPYLLANLFTCEEQLNCLLKTPMNLEVGLLLSNRQVSYYLLDLASLIVEYLSSPVETIREIVQSYEEVFPLTNDEIVCLDCFVRLQLVVSITDETQWTQLEILSSNLSYIRNLIR